MTTEPTLTLYEVGQHAGERYAAEFAALRAAHAAMDPTAIASTDLGGAIATHTIVSDHDSGGVDADGKGYAPSGGQPMTNAEVVAYLDEEIDGHIGVLDEPQLDDERQPTLAYDDVIVFCAAYAPDVNAEAVWRRLEAEMDDSATNRDALHQAIAAQHAT